jgi:hypothetical protein
LLRPEPATLATAAKDTAMPDTYDIFINARQNVDQAMRDAGRGVDELKRKTDDLNKSEQELAKTRDEAQRKYEEGLVRGGNGGGERECE